MTRDTVLDQIWGLNLSRWKDQVRAQVYDQVDSTLLRKMREQSYDRVWRLMGRVQNLLRDQIKDQS